MIFDRLFRNKKQNMTIRHDELVNETAVFTGWSGDAYSSDIYREAVDAIARNIGKLKGSHVIRYADHNKVDGDCKLNRLLQIRPNPYMSAYDFLYKMATHFYLYNNCFALLNRDKRGNVTGIYPITSSQVERKALF